MTARRREENLQEVPVAITAIGAEDLELRSIENTEDLNVLLPNVDIRGTGTNGGGSGNFAIRGIPGVARYVDGVALDGNQGSLENVVELERIEVLRGPQGTYFGKNAISGAIQYIAQKPANEFGARVKMTLGEYNRQDIVANVDVPLGDTVRSKVTYAQLSRDGFVDSTMIDESFGSIDNAIVRGMLEWTPTDQFTATFTAESSKQDGNMQPQVLWGVYFGIPGPMTPEQYNAQGIPFNDELYAYGKREEYLNTVDYDPPGFEMNSDFFSANLSWDINDSVTFRSITARREFDWGLWNDLDATQFVMFDRWNYQEQEETTQELQLLGNGERYTWVVGLYYYESDLMDKFQSWQRWELTGTGAAGPRPRNELENVIRTDTALFAEFTYDITEKLELTVGARYSEEEYEFSSLLPSVALQEPKTISRSLAGTTRLVNGVPQTGVTDFDATTPRVALQYQWTDNIMTYISVAEGFNAGGVNPRFDPTLPNNGITPYTGETLTNTEIGLRSDLLEDRLRLNVNYFDGTWEDIQIAEVLVPGTTTTTNAGEAEIDGFEIEMIYRATDNFAINLNAGWLNTQYTDVGQATTISIGSTFPFAPESSYSVGFQWDNDLENGGGLSFRMDYGWIDDFQTFRDDRFQLSIANGDYGLLSGRLQYTPAAGNWDMALFGTNLTDEYYQLGGFSAVLAGIDQGVLGRPREVGVTLRLRL